jgi:hypothetical protein
MDQETEDRDVIKTKPQRHEGRPEISDGSLVDMTKLLFAASATVGDNTVALRFLTESPQAKFAPASQQAPPSNQMPDQRPCASG